MNPKELRTISIIAAGRIIDPASGLEILADEADRPGASCGLHDERIPERQLGSLLEGCCVEDQPDIDLDDVPGRVQRDDLASLGPAHRWPELAGRDDVELLEDLGAHRPRAVRPQLLEQCSGDRLLLRFAGVVGVQQDVGVDERPPAGRHRLRSAWRS